MATERCLLDGDVIIIGDTNCHIGPEVSNRGWGLTTANAQHLLNMAERQTLWVTDLDSSCTGPNYTYFRENTGRSYIDHCLVSTGLRAHGVVCCILPDSVLNTSDHLAVTAVLKDFWAKGADSPPTYASRRDSPGKPCWHKCIVLRIFSIDTLSRYRGDLHRSC